MKTMKFIQQLGLIEAIVPVVYLDVMGEDRVDIFYQTKIDSNAPEELTIELTANRLSYIATNVSLFVKLTDWINENQTIPEIFLQCGKRLYKIASVEQNTEVCHIHINKVLDHVR